MLDRPPISWKEATFSPNNQVIPMERWGHKIVKVKNYILLFGGFGGTAEGKYLNDLWKFDLETYQWSKIQTQGKIPQKRSNYTMHYNEKNNQIIIFGGGSENKARFNELYVLDLEKNRWTKIDVDLSEQTPWQRTYHTSQFCYPYLVIFGGEGISNIDLGDSWAFNIQTNKWMNLQFQKGCHPNKRRFHCSILHGTFLYIIGGCRDNYDLLGDIHRTDLKQLFDEGRTCGFKWQCLMKNNVKLGRWGHTCEQFNGKIYIVAGRISTTQDSNNVLVFDPVTNELKEQKIDQYYIPKPRRRHSSVMVGSSILIFGGYNGKYLNDFAFLTLPTHNHIPDNKYNAYVTQTQIQFKNKLQELQGTIKGDYSIEFISNNRKYSIQTNHQELMKNKLFKYLKEYSSNGQISIEASQFCTPTIFRCVNLAITIQNFIFCQEYGLDYYFNLIRALEYFNCSGYIYVIENYLISATNYENCMEIMELSKQLPLTALMFHASEIYLKMASLRVPHNQGSLSTVNLLKSIEYFDYLPKSGKNFKTIDSQIKEVYQFLKFQIEQSILRNTNRNIFQKTAMKLQNIFTKSQTPQNKIVFKKIIIQKQAPKNKNCLKKITNYFIEIFRRVGISNLEQRN